MLTALRTVLAEHRDRGAPFDDAWDVAAKAAVGIGRHGERREWLDVLAGTRHAWRAAYCNAPAPVDTLPFAVMGEDRDERIAA